MVSTTGKGRRAQRWSLEGLPCKVSEGRPLKPPEGGLDGSIEGRRPSRTHTPTHTHQHTPTHTPTHTNTHTDTHTPIHTHQHTHHQHQHTHQHTNTHTHQHPHQHTPTNTPTHQHTPTHTNPTPTHTHQHTPTHTNTHQHTPTHTNTNTPTHTNTTTHQHPPTHTNTHQHTPTHQHTNTHQHTPTSTNAPTPTNTHRLDAARPLVPSDGDWLMKLTAQPRDHFAARGLLSKIRHLKQRLTFAHPPFTTLFLGHKIHVRLDRKGFFEFRRALALLKNHERSVTRRVNRVTTHVVVTIRRTFTAASCIWRTTFCCSRTRASRSRSFCYAVSASFAEPDEPLGRCTFGSTASSPWLGAKGDLAQPHGRVTGRPSF